MILAKTNKNVLFSVTTVDANMAAERDEVVGSARDEFRTKCELDVAAVTRITAFSDLTHDLVTEKPTEVEVDQEKHKVEKFTVLTNLVAVVECELDVAALTRITAFSDLTHNVVTKNPLRAGASKKTQVEKFTVLTNLVAVVDGEVKYIQAVILYPERRGKKVQSMKFPAKDLFDLAPDTAAYSLMKKFSELTFQLGRTYSDGMNPSVNPQSSF